jgi:hypothetical protein
MTAAMFTGEGGYQSVVGEKLKTKLPAPIGALKQGSNGPTISDLQFEMENERKQHEDAYKYANGSHANDNVPLGNASF